MCSLLSRDAVTPQILQKGFFYTHSLFMVRRDPKQWDVEGVGWSSSTSKSKTLLQRRTLPKYVPSILRQKTSRFGLPIYLAGHARNKPLQNLCCKITAFYLCSQFFNFVSVFTRLWRHRKHVLLYFLNISLQIWKTRWTIKTVMAIFFYKKDFEMFQLTSTPPYLKFHVWALGRHSLLIII